jgi:hypothetical protein
VVARRSLVHTQGAFPHRERKRVITGKKVEGRKSHVELRPELVALVR